jgi:hypothetical protein
LKEVCSKTYYDDMQAHMGKSSQTFWLYHIYSIYNMYYTRTHACCL